MPVLKFIVQKSTLAGVEAALVVRIDGFQLPGAVDRRHSASTLSRNAVRVRPSGSVTKPSSSIRKSPMYGAAAPRPPVGLISTMLRAAVSVKVVPTKNPLFCPTFAPVIPLISDRYCHQ